MAGEMKIQIRQISPTTSEAVIRQHRALIDRPAAKGGADAGPMGGELFLAAVGGCFMSNLLAAIRAREADVSGVQTEVTASLADAPPRFANVELSVTASCSDRDLLAKLVEIADRGCIMLNTLRAGVGVAVRVAEPALSRAGD